MYRKHFFFWKTFFKGLLYSHFLFFLRFCILRLLACFFITFLIVPCMSVRNDGICWRAYDGVHRLGQNSLRSRIFPDNCWSTSQQARRKPCPRSCWSRFCSRSQTSVLPNEAKFPATSIDEGYTWWAYYTENAHRWWSLQGTYKTARDV